jgi:hypothetical protein
LLTIQTNMTKKISLAGSQVEKIINFLENKNQFIFHRDKTIFLLTQDDEYSTVSRVSIYPPYILKIDDSGKLGVDVGYEKNSGFNYASRLKNMFVEAVKQLKLI